MAERWYAARADRDGGKAHLYEKTGERQAVEIRSSCRWKAFAPEARRKVPRAGSKLTAAKALLKFPEGQRCTTCSETAIRTVKESQ